jgi:hypothetical protein
MYRLTDLRPVLQAIDSSGVDLVVAGGFAIFLWAERYAGKDERYVSFVPFTSRDLDLIGDREDAVALGKALHTRPTLNPGADPSPNAGVLLVDLKQVGRLRIDVLMSVFGVDYAEAFSSAQIFEFPEEGFKLKVLEPYLCLQNKVKNLLYLPQENRSDYRHTRLTLLNLENRLLEQISDRGFQREILRTTERVYRFALSPEGIRVWENFGLKLEDAIPVQAFPSGGPKLAQFAARRFPQLRDRLAFKRSAATKG